MPEIQDLPGNSNKEKRNKPVTQGTRLKDKRGFIGNVSESLFGGKADGVGHYIVFDVLVPALKSTISDIISSGIEMLLYGEARGRSGPSRRTFGDRVSYGGYYRDREQRSSRGSSSSRHRIAPSRLTEIVVDYRADAEEVISSLNDQIKEYGVATVADFYDLVGLNTEWTDNKYGWDAILTYDNIRQVREGYIIDLPRPIELR